MPGFSIAEGGDKHADPKIETMREHRYVLTNFLNETVNNTSPFFYLIDVELPGKIKEELAIKTPSTTYKFPKSVSYTDLRLTLYALPKLAAEIKKLEDKIHTTTDGLKDFDDYMGEVRLLLYDGEGEPQTTFVFKNAFIAEVQWGRLTYASSEIKTVSIIVKFSQYETE